MSTPAFRFDLDIIQIKDFELEVRFDKPHYNALRMDEPPPLGQDTAPNPARFLAAAIGNCLSASLVFCMKKANVKVEGLQTRVSMEIVRNENKRLRVGKVDVYIKPNTGPMDPAMKECLSMFEDFCIVTQSVREGIDVQTHVELT